MEESFNLTSKPKKSIVESENKGVSFSKKQSSSIGANDSDASFQFSFKAFFKNCFLVTLPHLAIFLIFLFYILLGAAILKEIESDRPLVDLKSKSSHSITSQLSNDFKEIQTSFFNLELEFLENIKKYQETSYSNYNNFLTRYNKALSDLLQSSNKTKTLNSNKNSKSEDKTSSSINLASINNNNDEKTLKFVTKLYNKQKNNLNVDDVFKAIAKNLIDYKKEMKDNLNLNIDILFKEYDNKQKENIKLIYDLINKQELLTRKQRDFVFSSTSGIFNAESSSENIQDESSKKQSESSDKTSLIKDIVENRISKKNEKWNFSTSLYFVGSLLTTIGKFY